MMRSILSAFVMLAMTTGAFSADVMIYDDSVKTGETKNWVNTNTYILKEQVFVEDGAVLSIQAGTVIKADDVTPAAALIIAQGGKIYAKGTATQPIIFTSIDDDISDPTDLTYEDRGLWGGIIVLGKATVNTADTVSNQVEGIDENDPRGAYGGSDDADSSGVLQYVSIRHGGAVIGADNEINGLTLGGVGSKTVIEHVEVFANLDDGFEWFGGTANTKWLISAFCGDDAFDYDEGFRGRGQFWFVVQDSETGNHAGEHDGGTTPEDGTPYAEPWIYNVTYIGSGASAGNTSNGMLKIRDNAGGHYHNSVFTDFSGIALTVEDLGTGEDSRKRLEDGSLTFKNNIFHNFGAGSAWADILKSDDAAAPWLVSSIEANGNSIADPQLKGISRVAGSYGLDPRPTAGGPAWGNLAALPDTDFFTTVDYKGAFGTQNWADGWSMLSDAGILATVVPMPANEVMIYDDSIKTGETKTWTNENVYILMDQVFVEDGAVLNIEAGTVIKAEDVTPAAALIVAQGGKIHAMGTATAPIIFTSIDDDISDPTDLTYEDRGLWGGIIVLGKATVNTADTVSNQVEGIDENDPRGTYGGTADDDSSGVLKYVSIRHGGAVIGADNEINGLTLGGVGNKTVIEHIEVYANLDDGVEWFGGTVNTKYIVSAFCGDDAFDYDEGFRGKGQFWLVVQDSETGNHAGEHDGGTTPEDGTPYAEPWIYNATYIGSGANAGNTSNGMLKIRDNAGGHYHNSVFTDFSGIALTVEDLETGEDSRKRLEDGSLTFKGNIFHNFGAGSDWASILKSDDAAAPWLVDSIEDNSNTIADPELHGISRVPGMGALDPRPAVSGPAYQNLVALPSGDSYFEDVDYKGAFGQHNWAAGWTMLAQASILTDIEGTPIVHKAAPAVAQSLSIGAVKTGSAISLVYSVPSNSDVRVDLYASNGRLVGTLVNTSRNAGVYETVLPGNKLSKGHYVAALRADGLIKTTSFIVK